ncbi:MAG TPA: hypothetical protein VHL79_24485 [Ramlibacter sp.]|jgi:hypothetical protein|nr:hypothetical protein [Ramlibacter sp.]
MAKPHFAIERPRKIRIAIEGYDPQARVQAQRRKQQERRQRLERSAAAIQTALPAIKDGVAARAELALPQSSTPRPVAPADGLEQQLLDAFLKP